MKDDISKGINILYLDEALVEYIQYVPLRHQDRAVGGVYLHYLLKVAGERGFKLDISWVVRFTNGVVDWRGCSIWDGARSHRLIDQLQFPIHLVS